MTSVDVTDFGSGVQEDGFIINVDNCLFKDNTIVEDQVIKLMHVKTGSVLSSCFTGNSIGSKALITADVGSSMVYADLYGENNNAPAWTCESLGIQDFSLGAAHYITIIQDLGDGTVAVTKNECPDEGFIFDASECQISERDIPEAPPPTPALVEPDTGEPPTVATPDPPVFDGPPCQVCPDGTEIPQPTRVSQRFGASCRDLEVAAQSLEEGSSECTNAQVISVIDCDCPYVPPAESASDVACTLCSDSFVPIPSLVVNPRDGSSICGVFEWQAHDFDSRACQATQATAGAACGCANAPTAPCEVVCTKDNDDIFDANSTNSTAPPTSSSFDIKKFLTDAVVGDKVWKGEWMCGEILWAESIDPNACSDTVKRDLRLQCCPDEVVEKPAPQPTQPPSTAISFKALSVFWTLALGVGLGFVVL